MEFRQRFANVFSKAGGVKKSGIIRHQGGRSYSTLEDVMAKLRPLLTENDLYVKSSMLPSNENTSVGSNFMDVRVCDAKSDLCESAIVPVATSINNKNQMHEIGSATTYALRYGLKMLFCLDTGEDDDAVSLTPTNQNTATKTSANAPVANTSDNNKPLSIPNFDPAKKEHWASIRATKNQMETFVRNYKNCDEMQKESARRIVSNEGVSKAIGFLFNAVRGEGYN